MTHIDTYSHRIPHKLTQLHTNTHILHTFTHKLPHLWVGHKKSHVYIYIYIYIQQNQHIHTSIKHTSTTTTTPIIHRTQNFTFIQRKKKFFNQKSKQIKSIHSFRSFIHSKSNSKDQKTQ